MSFLIESLGPGNYTVRIQTRDKENNLSDGITSNFIFLSQAPVNVRNISASVFWNVLHLDWDSLEADDFITEVEGNAITIPVDTIIVTIDDAMRLQLPVTATGAVIPDLSDGYHEVKIFTYGHSGYYSGKYSQIIGEITFGQKFVRVQGNGYDFYIARYEVTTGEYKAFVLNTLKATKKRARYFVDPLKVEPDAWYASWLGKDPLDGGGEIRTISAPSVLWEFGFDDGPVWTNNRYKEPNGAFGKITWEGAMLYSLINYNGRCPTQDEWLYAAKGGPLTHNYDYAGSNDPDAVGWWGPDDGAPNYWWTANVGTKLPNELGIYDMSGNIGEILYETDPSTTAIGKTIIIGGSKGPAGQNGWWGNEGEIFSLEKPKLTDPEIVKHTGTDTNGNSSSFRTGCRVLIPHSEIVKLPFDRHKYEK
jgi:hypothetical protein